MNNIPFPNVEMKIIFFLNNVNFKYSDLFLFIFYFYVLIEKRDMRRMRNPPHKVQAWSKELSKPPLTKESYTRGTKGRDRKN